MSEPETAKEKVETEARRRGWMKAGAAVGVGSAAIVAALLFARQRAKKK